MRITKKYILHLLNEICTQLGYFPPKVQFIPDRIFVKAYLNLPVSKQLIDLGIYDKDTTPSFMAMGQNTIFVSLYRANKGLSQFDEYHISEYLKFALAHELTHINDPKKNQVEDEINANEKAKMVVDLDAYNYVNNILWKDVIDRINEYKKRHDCDDNAR
mgnify:CR=1 FL=1